MQNSIKVAVGILFNEDETLLLCQRSPNKSYPLKWEFPGGKVEAGEEPEEALRRELSEELGIEATVDTLLHRQTTRYSDGRTYQVDYFRVVEWSRSIVNREFASIEWTTIERLQEYDILEGNGNICRLLAEKGGMNVIFTEQNRKEGE